MLPVFPSIETNKTVAQTEILLLIIPHLTVSYIKQTTQSPAFLEGVSNRLQAMRPKLRFMGMAFATALTARDDSSPRLKLDEVDGFDEEYNNWKPLLDIHDVVATDESCWDDLNDSQEIATENSQLIPERESGDSEEENPHQSGLESETEEEGEFRPFAIIDDGSEDSDDDPTVRREKVRPPVYMIDLIAYFNDSNESTSAQKHKVALMHATKIILRKADYGQELATTSKELAQVLCGLRNNFGLNDFDQQKMNAMIALCVTAPETVSPLHAEYVTFGDYSLQERLIMLSSIALAALHLSGKSTYNFEVSREDMFPSRLLPPDIHARFALEKDYPQDLGRFGLSYIENSVRAIKSSSLRESVTNAIENADTSKSGEIFVSRRLQTERDQRGGKNLAVQKNSLAKIAGQSFFFPLASRWKSFTSTLSRNAFGEMLLAHYVKTMAIILNSSYPAATDIFDMSSELMIIISTIRRDTGEPSVLEAIFTSILVIMDVNEEASLIQYFSKQFLEIKEYLEASWEGIGAEDVRNLAAGLLVKISEMVNKWQRRLVGEYISMGG